MTYEVGTLEDIGAQVGDVVEWGVSEPPQQWTITLISGEDYYEGDDHEAPISKQPYWRTISRANQGPVREVTTVRKEVVPGVYGPLTIRATDELGPVQLEINGTIGRTWFNKSDVESLIDTLTKIRDTMAYYRAT